MELRRSERAALRNNIEIQFIPIKVALMKNRPTTICAKVNNFLFNKEDNTFKYWALA
jgi:hypothetical protein